jgi:hypothetical protein
MTDPVRDDEGVHVRSSSDDAEWDATTSHSVTAIAAWLAEPVTQRPRWVEVASADARLVQQALSDAGVASTGLVRLVRVTSSPQAGDDAPSEG